MLAGPYLHGGRLWYCLNTGGQGVTNSKTVEMKGSCQFDSGLRHHI